MRNQAEANLKALIESTEDLIWSVDLDCRLITFNSALQKHILATTGVQLAAGMLPMEIMEPESVDFMRPLYERALQEGPFRTEYSLADGRTLELAFNPIVTDGATTGISVFGKDISERKRADRALREAETKYRSIFDGALEGMFQTTLDGRVLAANSAVAKILGYDSPEDALTAIMDVSRDVWQNPAQRSSYLGQLQLCGFLRNFECEVRRKDGKLVRVSVSARMVCDEDRRPLYIDGFLEDISERKRAEDELHESRDSLREAQTLGGLGNYALDVGKGVWTSSALLDELFGIDETYDRSVEGWAALIHPDDQEMMTAYFQQEVIDKRRPFDKEYRIVRQTDRATLWVHGLGRLEFDAEGRPLRMRGVIRDVTERQRALRALEESEARFRKFFEENSSVMLIVEPMSGEICDANETAAAYYGYSRQQLLGMRVDQINTLPEEEVAPERLSALREERSRFSFRHRLASGEERDVETFVSRMEVDGRVLLFSIVHDIGDRKRAEAQLRDSEERYRATFEQAAVGIVHTALDGRILRCNARFAEIIGYPRDEVPGMTFQQITRPEDLPESIRELNQFVSGRAPSASWEKRYIRKDGSLTWVKLTISVQRDERGRALHLISVVEDSNARKEAEGLLTDAANALQLSEERYRTVFQTSLDAFNINRLSDGVFVDVNESFLRFTGCAREDVIGHTSRELNFWVDPDIREKMIEILRQDSSVGNLEARFRRKDGGIVWGQVSESMIETDGVPCILSVTRDITAAKEADDRLAATMAALRASEVHYRTVFQTSVDGICISQLRNGQYIDANRAFLELMGYEREEVIGRTTLELNFWAEPELRRQMATMLERDESFKDVETQFVKKNGERVWTLVSATAMEIENVPCVLSVVRDISATKAAEERLAAVQQAMQASEIRYRTAFQTSLDSININRLSDGSYIDCNQAFLDSVGYTREEVIGKTSVELNIWANSRDRQKLVEMLRQTGHCRDLEAQFKRKNGEIFWGQMSASTIEVDGVPCILSISRDISGAKVAEDEIRNLAFYDPLTHLPNRRLVSERLRQSMSSSARSNRKGALLFIDVDNFKTLNDTLGHKTGDLLLQEVARRLTHCIRDADTVARLGGDEFVVILEDLSGSPEEAAAQAKMVAEKILAAVSQNYVLAGRECLSTSSVGITVFGDRNHTIDDVLQQADIAMYQAKSAGRNTLRFFAPALQAAINARASMEEDLRQAIGTGQFQLYYQPQVLSGALIGAEALLRWNHPQRGFFPPADFIALAEDTGLILPLGDWVLETACRQIAAWSKRKETAHIAVGVNISARQLRQPDFVERVLSAIERTGANPKKLDLELTESMLVENIEEVIAKMTVLKSHGVRFSLDDFGTGYSSLSYLKRLPLDTLKIDRAFVHDMLVDMTSGAIAQTVISLCKAMGLSVIAEGVETEQQREFLAGLGCHAFQGYLFSPALPIDEFELLPCILEPAAAPPSIH
jgi:diguanylate cyclase (GGDEF)-like protein/PAS domain S-box-containing protein